MFVKLYKVTEKINAKNNRVLSGQDVAFYDSILSSCTCNAGEKQLGVTQLARAWLAGKQKDIRQVRNNRLDLDQ